MKIRKSRLIHKGSKLISFLFCKTEFNNLFPSISCFSQSILKQLLPIKTSSIILSEYLEMTKNQSSQTHHHDAETIKASYKTEKDKTVN